MTTDVRQQPKIDLSATYPLATINRSAAARELKIHVSIVSRILSTNPERRRVPHLHTFRRLAVYLGMSLDELYLLLYPTLRY